LVGSLLRGLAELGDDHEGRWWLTDDGRPVFVLGEGQDAAAGAAAVIARLRESTTDRGLDRVLAEIDSGLGDMRAARRRLAAWEDELTQLAAPQPLRLDVFAPASAADVAVRRRPITTQGEEAVPSWRAGLHERLSSAYEAARARTRRLTARLSRSSPDADAARSRRAAERPPRGRRRPMLVGVGAAALVLTAGLLWPTGDADEPAVAQTQDGDRERPSASPTTRPATPKATAEADVVASADDAVSAASVLLDGLKRCLNEKDATCADTVADGSAPAVLAAISEPDGADALTLVESYGDIAVIRRRSAAKERQILVLLRQKDEWLVRDVYDVANQPGSS
jgi:hypothetical protein